MSLWLKILTGILLVAELTGGVMGVVAFVQTIKRMREEDEE